MLSSQTQDAGRSFRSVCCWSRDKVTGQICVSVCVAGPETELWFTELLI